MSWVCKQCGSEEVQSREWVWMNDWEVVDGAEVSQTWCATCDMKGDPSEDQGLLWRVDVEEVER